MVPLVFKPKPIRIHAKVQGGLGNQLFIWAAGFSLACRIGGSLTIDDTLISKLNRNQRLDNRKFELGSFNIRRSRRALVSHRTYRQFSELSFDYDQRFSAIDGSVVLLGNFQSWRYMEGQESRIREVLSTNARLSPGFTLLRLELESTPWIGVHVRRGDYLRVGVLNIVERDYYEKAIRLAQEETGAERVIVFSDDVGLAKEVVPGAARYIGGEEMHSPVDTLMLMATCNAFVGANSSFSWWAAFLNQDENAMKIFPEQWFSDSSIDCPDLLVEDWLRI